MDLEKLRVDESLWPEGAEAYVGGFFRRWRDGEEMLVTDDGVWFPAVISWSISEWVAQECGGKIVMRPSPKNPILTKGWVGFCTWGLHRVWHECVCLDKGQVCVKGTTLGNWTLHDLDESYLFREGIDIHQQEVESLRDLIAPSDEISVECQGVLLKEWLAANNYVKEAQ